MKAQLLLLTILLVPVSFAQSTFTTNTLKLDDPAERPAATIDDFAWFAGHWRGEGLGGVAEEVWTSPLGSTMTGAFKLSKADTVVFYEIMALVEEENSVSMWIKHFNPDFTGWEEKHDKVVFPLVRLEPGATYFSGLTFQRTDDDAMDVYLALKQRDGNPKEMKFTYRRQP